MAKPLKRLQELELPEDTSSGEENHEPETTETIQESVEVQELKKIEEVLSAAEVSGGTVRLERKGPSDLKWQFIGKIKVEDFSQDHIRSVYGGGDYRAQTFRSNGSFYKRFEFTIDYRFKGSMDFVPALPDGTKPDALAAQIAAQSGQSTKALMDVMAQSQQQNQNNMMLMMNIMQENSKTTIAMMGGMFQALSSALAKPQGDQSSQWLPLMIEMVKSNAGKPATGGGGTDIKDMIAAVRDLQALAKGEKPPEEEKEDMLDKVLKYGGPIVTALLTRTPLQMPGAVPPPSGPIIDTQPPEPKVIPPTTPRSAPAADKALMEKINTYMELLISGAERNGDPGAYASMIGDMLSDEHFATLLGELEAPDWFEKIAGGNPRIMNQREWFTNLRQELFAMTEDPNDTAEPDGSGPGTPGSNPPTQAS